MTTCTPTGPCKGMRSAIARGTVLLLAERPTLRNGEQLATCMSCGKGLSPALVADWPWAGLRAMGAS